MSLAPGTSRRTSTPSRAAAAVDLDVCGGADEVRVGQPQVLPCKAGDDEVEAVSARLVRLAGNHANPDVPGPHTGAVGYSRNFGQRRATAGPPHIGERSNQFADCGTAQLDAGVAPRLERAARVSAPLGADAQATHETDRAVDDDRLPVVAREPLQWTREAGADRTPSPAPPPRAAGPTTRHCRASPASRRSRRRTRWRGHARRAQRRTRARSRRRRRCSSRTGCWNGPRVSLPAMQGNSRRRRATGASRCRRSAPRRSRARTRGRHSCALFS